MTAAMFEAPYVFIDCSSLYNVLNESFECAKISDPFYLYLLGKRETRKICPNEQSSILSVLVVAQKDCRSKSEYNESHIVSAKHMKKDGNDRHRLLYEAELESRNLIVVYDGHTNSSTNEGHSDGSKHSSLEQLSYNSPLAF
jgi:hypothetical protein